MLRSRICLLDRVIHFGQSPADRRQLEPAVALTKVLKQSIRKAVRRLGADGMTLTIKDHTVDDYIR